MVDAELSPLSEDSLKSVHFYCVERLQNDVDKTFNPTFSAVNARFRLIALGTARGNVIVYHLNAQSQLVLSHKLDCDSLATDSSVR